MFSLLQLTVIFLAFIYHEYEAIAQYIPPYATLVSPVNKHIDASKPLYSVQIDTLREISRITHANFLIDIDATFIWHDCIKEWNIHPITCPMYALCVASVSCKEFQCTKVRTSYTYKNPSCLPETNSSVLPGSADCLCTVNVANSFYQIV